MAEKKYINGNGKEISGRYGSFFNLSFRVEDLQKHANEKGYVNITMSKRKAQDPYGNTHYFTLNEWKGKEGRTDNDKYNEAEGNGDFVQEEEISIEDIPF